MLLVIELVLAARYFSHVHINALRRFNVVVGALVVNAIVLVLATYAFSWKSFVLQRERPSSQGGQNHGSMQGQRNGSQGAQWALPLVTICNLIAATLEHCFLVYQYYGLSKKRFWSGLIMFMIVAHVIAGLITAVGNVVDSGLSNPLFTSAMTTAFCVSAAIDVFIPMLLILELRDIMAVYSGTPLFVRILTVNAASSGAIVALAEILLLIFYWTRIQVKHLISGALGPLYGITVFVNLSAFHRREPFRTPLQSKSRNFSTRTGNLSTFPAGDSIQRVSESIVMTIPSDS